MIELYHMDCMDYMATLEDNAFELAIVDPPYGIGCVNQASSRKKYNGKIKWNDNQPSPEYFKQIQRVSKNQIIWGINYYTKNVKATGRIIHNKVESGGHRFRELSDADIASHSFGVNIKVFNFIWFGNVYGNKRTVDWKGNSHNARIHPTQKPVELYKWLLENYAKPGDKILDTHLGSGSIAIACHDYGFDLVGCELDKEYYNAATKRLKRHQSQLTMAM